MPVTRELFPGAMRSRKSRPKEARQLQEHEILMGVFLSELRLDFFREFQFLESRKWRWDFCVPGENLAIELEGGLYTGGRHTRGPGYQEDLTKYQEGACMGWHILRFSVQDVMNGRAKSVITRWLKVQKDNPLRPK